MNILCYNIEKGLIEAIALKLLPSGFHIFHAESIFDLKKILFSKGIRLIIADLTDDKNKNEINIKFLKWLSTIDQKNEIKRIIISSATDEYSIRKLMEMGIHSFISKKNPTADIIEKIEGIISKMDLNIKDGRQHVRVKPSDDENPLINFYIGSEKITGKIVNISMGGVLVQVPDKAQIIGITKDQEIPRIHLSLSNKKIILNALVVLKRENLLALKYTSVGDLYKESLSKYIFSKISKI